MPMGLCEQSPQVPASVSRALRYQPQAKLKRMKGRPVALKKFLEEVVLPGCVLCSP
jgi:hypothetical protein